MNEMENLPFNRRKNEFIIFGLGWTSMPQKHYLCIRYGLKFGLFCRSMYSEISQKPFVALYGTDP